MRFLIFCLIFISVMYAEPITTLPVGSANIICLTFDDGPKNGATEELLDLLRSENIKATFFVIGHSIKNDPDLILRMQKEGHDIGNHTYDHINLSSLSPEQMEAELVSDNRTIQKITHAPVRFIRAPGGQYSSAVYAVCDKLGLRVINWSVNTADYMMDSPVFEKGEAVFVRTADMIEHILLTKVHPGAIILMHNGNMETIAALRQAIPKLKKQGYRFAKISDYYK